MVRGIQGAVAIAVRHNGHVFVARATEAIHGEVVLRAIDDEHEPDGGEWQRGVVDSEGRFIRI